MSMNKLLARAVLTLGFLSLFATGFFIVVIDWSGPFVPLGLVAVFLICVTWHSTKGKPY